MTEKEKKRMKKKNGTIKKIVLTALIVLAALASLYALFVLVANPIFYKEFYASAEKVQTIPDLWGGFVPQGVTTVKGKTLICGYVSSGASRIYLLENNSSKRLYLSTESGGVYDGHAGGVTSNGKYVYISNASKIFVLSAEDILKAKNEGNVAIIGRFEVPVRSSFCSCDGKYLYVGEFHRDGYETNETHAVKSEDGDYQAMIFAYEISPEEPFGVKTEPCAAYAVCDEVQGAAFEGGAAALSVSYGLKSSEIRLYDASGEPDGEFMLGEGKLPLFILDAHREKRTVKAPHMSEDVEFRNGKLLIAFEGGVLKYGGGLLPFSERSVMLFDPDLDAEES